MNGGPRPIGVFDSGVGGLSILRALRSQMPNEHFIYIADQAHVPYGSRPLEEVRGFAEGITRYLVSEGAKAIVIACNTASAAALHYLRQTFPEIPFVGMEPAVKPAAEQTRTGVVGVLATPATFQGELYASVVERFARGTRLLENTCDGLVQCIENGNLDGKEPRRILENALKPMLDKGMDTVVLGCTHYPFVIPLIQEIAGQDVRVIDPAPAIARRTQYVLQQRNALSDAATGSVKFFTTAEPEKASRVIGYLWNQNGENGGTPEVKRLIWKGGELTAPAAPANDKMAVALPPFTTFNSQRLKHF